MPEQVSTSGAANGFAPYSLVSISPARSRRSDPFVAFEQVGRVRRFARDEEIYGEGDPADAWFKVISGTVRICKFLADGRRYIAAFCDSGECFGLDDVGERVFSAEAVGAVTVTRYPRSATERLIDENPLLSRGLCEITLHDLAHAQIRMLRLGRMTASERVANFLLELSEQQDARRIIEVSMSRGDIADHLGLTIETVCRVLSAFKRDRLISIPGLHQIEVLDRAALEAVGET